MDHMDIRRKLPAYLDNEVSAEEKQEIKKHLGSCGICRAALADLELTMWHLKRLPEVEPPPWLSDRILSKVRAPLEPNRGLLWRFFSPLRVKLLLVLLAMALLGSSGYFILRTSRSKVMLPSPSQTVSHETVPRPVTPPAAPQGSAAFSTPPRVTPPVFTSTPPGTQAAVPSPGTQVLPPGSPPAPAVTPAPVPARQEEPELRPPEETALPEQEAVRPFGREEHDAPQDEKQ